MSLCAYIDRVNSSSNPSRPKFISFPGKIHLIQTDRELERVADGFSGVKEFGFDTETRPSFRKGEVHNVALLQLATDHDAYVIRLYGLTRFDFLREILGSHDVLKVGVAIRHDIKQLQKRFPFEPRYFVELQTLAKEKGVKNAGLKGMAEEVMQATLTKGPKLTNWEAKILSEQQLMYAATDAWIGLALYREIRARLG